MTTRSEPVIVPAAPGTEATIVRVGVDDAERRPTIKVKILAVSRHASMDVMRGYVRSRDQWRDYAGDGIL